MATFRLPGPVCTLLNALHIDAGTMCRASSPVPGTTDTLKLRSTHKLSEGKLTKGVGKLTAVEFEAAARSLGEGIDARLIHAFADVESGGKSGFGPEGLPVIAYEGHIFRRLTGHRYDKTHPLLSYRYTKKAGPEWQKNNKDQKAAWETLNAAIALDEDAALQSCSWGMFQVMGFNYEQCGYRTAKTFADAMKAGEKGQLDAFVGYCKNKAGMIPALRNKNYAAMATLYNGEDYGDYDKRIERAYRKHGGK
jgi:hypothetical protein